VLEAKVFIFVLYNKKLALLEYFGAKWLSDLIDLLHFAAMRTVAFVD